MTEKEVQKLELRLVVLKVKKKQVENIFADATSISGSWITQLSNWAGEIADIETKLKNHKG